VASTRRTESVNTIVQSWAGTASTPKGAARDPAPERCRPGSRIPPGAQRGRFPRPVTPHHGQDLAGADHGPDIGDRRSAVVAHRQAGRPAGR
jgi:hypothetical protein